MKTDTNNFSSLCRDSFTVKNATLSYRRETRERIDLSDSVSDGYEYSVNRR